MWLRDGQFSNYGEDLCDRAEGRNFLPWLSLARGTEVRPRRRVPLHAVQPVFGVFVWKSIGPRPCHACIDVRLVLRESRAYDRDAELSN
jgi:hypothetical protein